jgi:hypothetical protein
MALIAEAVEYLRLHGAGPTARRLFEAYISGRRRAYLLRSNYEVVGGLPLREDGLVFRFARPEDLAALTPTFPRVPPATFRTWLGPNHFLYLALAGDQPAAYRCDATIVPPSIRPLLHLRPDQVFMVDISTAPAFRRQGITRRMRIAMAREMLRLGYRDSWGLQRPLNREALAAFDRTPDVVERFGTLTRSSVLGHVRFSLTPSRGLSGEHVGALAQLVADLVPGAERIALLFNPGTTIAPAEATEAVTRVVAKLGIELRSLPVTESDDQAGAFADAFADAAREGADAMIVLDDPMYREHRRTIVGLARRRRLPALYERPEFVEAGGLAACARPAPRLPTLPPELSADVLRLDPLGGVRAGLTINEATAQALGLTVPRALRLRADAVIGSG